MAFLRVVRAARTILGLWQNYIRTTWAIRARRVSRIIHGNEVEGSEVKDGHLKEVDWWFDLNVKCVAFIFGQIE